MNTKKEINLEIHKIFEAYQYEYADVKTLEKVDSDISMLLYTKGGYESDFTSKNFNPLIPNVNYTIAIETVESGYTYLILGNVLLWLI